MDRFSTIAIRSSLIWLLFGITAGAAMLNDAWLPGQWRLWFGATHPHILFIGWFFQFTMGVAYWLLPRRRSPGRPVGYHEPLAFAGLGLLNLGLFIRVIVEPLQRAGHDGRLTEPGFGVSAALQVAAFAIFASQIWPRAATRYPRAMNKRADGELANTGQEGVSS